MLKVGLLGCGGISNIHMNVYRLLKNDARVVAVCDSDIERARSIAERFGVGAAFDNHVDLLAVSHPDIIDICTPTSSHARLAVDSARSGCHVLVEKPMARSSEECRAIIQEAEKNRIRLCICHNNLFSPVLRKARQIIGEKNLTISSCSLKLRVPSRLQQSWSRDIKEGGPLWEAGAHAVYVQRFLLGEIGRVFAMSNKIRADSDDNFNILLQTRSGSLGPVDLAYWQNESHQFSCQIDCRSGEQIDIDMLSDYLRVKRPPYSDEFLRAWVGNTVNDLTRVSAMRFGYARKYLSSMASGKWNFIRRTHLGVIGGFIASLKEGTPPPVSGQDGLETIRILEAVASSIEKGESTTL